MFGDFKQIKAYFSKIDSFDELLIIQQKGRGFGKAEMIKEFKSVLKQNDNYIEVFKTKPELWMGVGINTVDDLLDFCDGINLKKSDEVLKNIFMLTK